MALPTVTWDPSSPAGSDALNAGDDAIRLFKDAVSERFRNGGHSYPIFGSGPTTVATDGLHCCGVNFTAGGSEAAHEFRIYDTDKTTTLVSFRGASFAATPSEVFFGANKVRTTGNVTAATGTFSGAVSMGALTVAAITATGHLAPGTDNTYDLGIDGTADWRDLFLQRNAKIGGTLLVSGIATFSAIPVFSAGVTFSTLAIFNGGISVAAGQNTALNGPQTSNETVLNSTRAVADSERILIAALTGNITVTLPAVASSNGRELWITIGTSDITSRTCTIDGNASETIDGATTCVLRQLAGGGFYTGVHLICDGSTWHIVDSHIRT